MAMRKGSPPAKRRPVRQPDSSDHAKRIWKPGTMLNPVPVVMVTCMAEGHKPNIITVAWAGTVCSEPPMLSISIREATHSYGLIKESREFVVNIPSVQETRATDYCGVASGRQVDKFAETGLTAVPASTVNAPLIAECPVNIECKTRKTVPLGSHTMFIAEVTAVQVTDQLINRAGRLALEKAGLIAFAHGRYYILGKELGHFGYSVRKKKKGKSKRSH